MNNIFRANNPEHRTYRRFLVAQYTQYQAKHVDIQIHDDHELQTEFLKLAINTWLSEAILPVRYALERWPQTLKYSSSENASQVQHIAENFTEFAESVSTFSKKINSMMTITFQLALPVILAWPTELKSIYEALNRLRTTLDEEEQFLLIEWFLPRVIEFQEDITEVLLILKSAE